MIKPPPQFEKLLEDDMLNPDFDEAAITPPPSSEPELVQLDAAAEPNKLSSSKTLQPPSKSAGKLAPIR